MFEDFDFETGALSPTTYESCRSWLLSKYPIAENVPEPIRKRLEIAVDYTALAYEQLNVGRQHLFIELTSHALTIGLLGMELVLKSWLNAEPESRTTFGPLLDKARARGLLHKSELDDMTWTHLHQVRNDLTHGNPDADHFGIEAYLFIGFIIGRIRWSARRSFTP